ncbi:hypothetical protein [Desulfonatronum thioautotrophicum]|uniref:hypothetical protein n=1 Tax=Desulfonatronum thioautotrophicum TaxID=617001 RepID=UPI0005EB69D8|nr:hypothetical protein [Desulfonatronum thioautotrophicum]
MKSLKIILLLAGIALTMSSCCPLRTTCTPVVVMHGVPAAVPVLPTYGVQHCRPGYHNVCAPYHLPYVTKPRAVPPLAAPSTSCCFPW